MKNSHGYKRIPLSFNRRTVISSTSVSKEKNTIHFFTEVDITEPRRLLTDYFDQYGEKLSFTGYIVTCLAHTLKDHPNLNSFIKGRNIIILNDITISVLIEREIDGEIVPEPLGIQKTQLKNYLEIHNEIRAAKNNSSNKLGGLSAQTWFHIIPAFLLKAFIRLADKNISMGMRYGKVAVSAVGMFGKEAIWLLPHGSATVLASVGSIINRVVEIDGNFESREHLCLTVSFDHDIVDGAPAARFMNQFVKEIKSGNLIKNIMIS